MSLKFKANLKDEKLVYGFCRRLEAEFDSIMSSLVMTTVLSFFAEYEYFEKFPEGMKVSGDYQNVITNELYGSHTAYGAAIIDLKANPNLI